MVGERERERERERGGGRRERGVRVWEREGRKVFCAASALMMKGLHDITCPITSTERSDDIESVVHVWIERPAYHQTSCSSFEIELFDGVAN